MKSVHDGVKYNCEQCDYKANQKGNLQQHVKSVHKGVKYSCERCYYEATKKVFLQRHVASNHERVIQSCDLCKMWLLTWGRQKQRVAISQSNQQMNLFSMLKYLYKYQYSYISLKYF